MAGPVGALDPVTLSAPVPCAVPDMQDFGYAFRYAVGSDVLKGEKSSRVPACFPLRPRCGELTRPRHLRSP
jgi:hypothetical protein